MIARQDNFGTKDEVWSALAAPVAAAAISWRQDGKPVMRDGRYFARFVCYIEANTVRERLDTVVPGEWDLTLEMLPQLHGSDEPPDSVCAFKARLQVLGVMREDVGTGRDYKQAATDAFKRAAVRFGIGNELYSFEQNWVEVDGDGRFAKPVEGPAAAYQRRNGSRVANNGQSTLSMGDGGRSEATPLADLDSVSCPKCAGRMWDNRLTKRNPKAPDYKCRDRGCDGVVWPDKGTRAAGEEAVAETEVSVPSDEPASPRKQLAPKLVTNDEIPF